MNYKKIGWRLILIPFVIMATVLVLAFLTNLLFDVFSSSPKSLDVENLDCTNWQIEQGLCATGQEKMTLNTINLTLFFVGQISFFSTIVCLPIGIWYVTRKTNANHK